MRTIGKIFVISSLLGGAAYAGSEAEPEDSLDSVGQMFLEISKETPVGLSHDEQMESCQTQQAEISAKMTSLKEFLALSDKQLSELTLKRAPSKEHSYTIALASFEIELRRGAGEKGCSKERCFRIS